MNLDTEDLVDLFVAESLEHLAEVESLLLFLETAEPDAAPAAVQEVFRAVHSVKGSAGFLGLMSIHDLAHAGENVLHLIRERELPVTPPLVDLLLLSIDRLRRLVACARDAERVDVSDLVKALESAAKTSTAIPSPSPAIPRAAPREDDAELIASLRQRETSLRVPAVALDQAHHLASDAAECGERLKAAIEAGDLKRISKIGNELAEKTCELESTLRLVRMRPIGTLFSRYVRVARDWGVRNGKRCDLAIEGHDVLVDQEFIEGLADPLLHLVRNALDHGLEAPEVRMAAGKAAMGRITLAARRDKNALCVEIRDDGAGICTERLRVKAVAHGLVTPEQAVTLSESETLQFIFAPGLSTAEKVTAMSGRGVGMDVVKANVERLGGEVEVESKLGCGTTIRMRFPASPGAGR